jgi:hypothetical protein
VVLPSNERVSSSLGSEERENPAAATPRVACSAFPRFSTSATRRPSRLELFSSAQNASTTATHARASRVALRKPCLKRSAFILLACPRDGRERGEVPIRLAQPRAVALKRAQRRELVRRRQVPEHHVHVLDVQLGVVQPAHGVRDLRQTQRDLREHDFDVGAALQVQQGNEALAVVGPRAVRPIAAERFATLRRGVVRLGLREQVLQRVVVDERLDAAKSLCTVAGGV